MKQDQFLTVLDRDEAERRFHAVLDLRPLPAEPVPLEQALGRVLAEDILAPVDVPGFDRSNVDGFAVRAEDTYGASEDQPRRVQRIGPSLVPGMAPPQRLASGQAAVIATGAMIPRGADGVVMVEDTDYADDWVTIRRPLVPGANITYAGTDIGRGETVLRRGDWLTSRETGVVAALGIDRVSVVRSPRVAILSTGNELLAPGEPMQPGMVYDSNAAILADAVRELGGEPIFLGQVPDELSALEQALHKALACDFVLLSGGTSKGEGDLSYRAVAQLGPPGIIAHGVALKPGKPLCLAAVRMPGAGQGSERVVPVAILPGFPTSAIFTFHEFVAPVIRRMAGRSPEATAMVSSRLPMRVNSERGRTEYLLVGLVQGQGPADLVAYPMGKGSGSVTTFSRADGFVIIPRQQEFVEAGSAVEVQLLGPSLRLADLVVIGSHCLGLDYLLGKLQERGLRTKFLAVGSQGGLDAARRGECDLAGIHLLDPVTEEYNRPFLTPELVLIPGYRRRQGVVFRPDDARFAGRSITEALQNALGDPDCMMVNRNRGSGTRILIDQLLGSARPPGYAVEAKSHHAVAAAVTQGRADWGVAIAAVATHLGFMPIQDESYDFVVPLSRLERPAIQAFIKLLQEPEVTVHLANLGLVALQELVP